MRGLPITWKSRLQLCRWMGLLVCGTIVSLGLAQANQLAKSPSRGAVQIRNYSIYVTLDPAHHSLTSQARVDFMALRNVATVTFHLNSAMHVTGVTDGSGNHLSATQGDGKILVTPASAVAQGSAAAWTFTYSGVFEAKSDGPLRLASVGGPVSYLLYRANWFPVVGDGTQRFTATIHVHVPAGELVLGSGPSGTPHPDADGQAVFDFNWPRPGFPGTMIAGKFQKPFDADSQVRVYLIDHGAAPKPTTPQIDGQKIAATVAKQYGEFAAQFGPTETGRLNIVELPDDTVPAAWSPEIAAIAGNQLDKSDSFRLLANTVARQWWGNQVSPATRNDVWITNGMCRYAELEYLSRTATPAVMADAILNVSASALAYDTVPLAEVVRYPEFSREFEAMTYDKGAMIFRMLRWQIDDAAFQETLRDLLSQADKSISSAKVEQIAEAASHQNLRPFFTQWLNTTGAPTLTAKWTIYRLGNNRGFRTMGEIDEDLDLFQMPVDVRVETEGKTVQKRVEVMGPQTQFRIDTFGIPTKVSLDPQRWLLRNDNVLQVRAHILRGLAKVAGNDDAGAIQEYRAALALDATSSLASYRLGEVYFRQRNYQAAEDAFRASLNGDGVPKWTEVWSDLHLGKIFDASGQRDRAINQYREAMETHDDTSGAVTLASEYLKHPYAPPAAATRH